MNNIKEKIQHIKTKIENIIEFKLVPVIASNDITTNGYIAYNYNNNQIILTYNVKFYKRLMVWNDNINEISNNHYMLYLVNEDSNKKFMSEEEFFMASLEIDPVFTYNQYLELVKLYNDLPKGIGITIYI